MPRCQGQEGCEAVPVARVAAPVLAGAAAPGFGFAIIRPISSRAVTDHAVTLCAEHTHLAVDIMLMRAMPEASA